MMAGAGTALQSFLLAFSALFSIVNPIGTALIFSQVTTGLRHAERAALAGRVGAYAAIVMVVSLWGGAYVLNFFGISLAALRIAGGLVVAVRAWELLAAPEATETRKQEQAGPAEGAASEDVAFFPLTIPLTTGPGTISVAVALGSSRPSGGAGLLPFFAGSTLAALAVAGTVALSYRWADLLVDLLGAARARVVTRLAAFLLLCIGTEIVLKGVGDVLAPLRAR